MITQQILKAEYRDAIRRYPLLMARIAEATGRTNRTIEDWVRKNDVELTTATNLNIIKEYLELPEDAELTESGEILSKAG